MRLVTCERRGQRLLGALIEKDARCVDLERAAEIENRDTRPFATMLNLIEAGESAWRLARELTSMAPPGAVFATAEARLLAPLPRPVQIRDFLCFEAHLVNAFKAAVEVAARNAPDPEAKRRELEASGLFEVPKVWYQRPLYYTPSRMAVCGPETDVVWPAYSQLRDYELELACVIGKRGKNIAKAEARDHIFGYTIFNDFSARDEQMIAMEGKLGPGKGKDFDDANVFGPCIVTADELTDAYSLTMTARVNGEEWSRGTSRDMYHSFEDLIAHVSRDETLHPGEILCSGTVGTGCGVEQMRFLNAGDVVELEVERIGVLRNRVVVR